MCVLIRSATTTGAQRKKKLVNITAGHPITRTSANSQSTETSSATPAGVRMLEMSPSDSQRQPHEIKRSARPEQNNKLRVVCVPFLLMPHHIPYLVASGRKSLDHFRLGRSNACTIPVPKACLGRLRALRLPGLPPLGTPSALASLIWRPPRREKSHLPWRPPRRMHLSILRHHDYK